MGTNESKSLSKDEIEEIENKTHFRGFEIGHILEKYETISSLHLDDWKIDKQEFREAFGLSEKPGIADRLFYAFDTNGDGFEIFFRLNVSYFVYLGFVSISFDISSIDAREFICALSSMSERATFHEKLNCLISFWCCSVLFVFVLNSECVCSSVAFSVFDIDKDGCISPAEMAHLLRASLCNTGGSLSEKQVNKFVTETFKSADLNGDGLITYDEFETLVSKHPEILQEVTIDTKAYTSP